MVFWNLVHEEPNVYLIARKLYDSVMSELLIPFGIHRHSGDIVEPEDAPKGRACNCLCPGCKAPLLSRHR
ncbi:MAG: hypothetical protein GY820_15065 [Gammaproteobacteria bacterium]|nr:hypothetical protein [Gammaproteobacteria bacterium]